MSSAEIQIITEKLDDLSSRVGELEKMIMQLKSWGFLLLGAALGTGALQVQQLLSLMG